jgi:hypothetical protein
MTQGAQKPARVSRRTVMLAVALAAVIAAVLIVTLSGGGSSGGKHGRHAQGGTATAPARGATDSQLASSYLGIPKATLRQRLRKGETLAEIAESTPGRSSRKLLRLLLAHRVAELRRHGASAAKVREAKTRLHARLTAELRSMRRVGATLPAAAQYLGVSESQLHAQLRSGRTLAQVADAHGHTRAQLVAAILAARKVRLDVAREKGQLTAAEEQVAVKQLRKRIERAVDRRI